MCHQPYWARVDYLGALLVRGKDFRYVGLGAAIGSVCCEVQLNSAGLAGVRDRIVVSVRLAVS